MKIISTLTLTGQNTSALLERGKTDLDKNRLMQGYRCKLTIPIANASGGPVTLSDAQRQSLLGGYRVKLSYNLQGSRIPYNLLTLPQMQRICRVLMGSEWEGYTDSTTGLARALPDAATTSVVLWVVIPTGYFWSDKKYVRFFGVGRSQAKTMQLEWKRETDTLPAGLTVSGNVTVEVYPDDFSCPKYYDRWTYIAEFQQVDETDRIAKLPRGLPLYVAEASAAQASSSLTDIQVEVGQDVLFSNLSAEDGLIQKLDVPNFPSDAYPIDRETPLHFPMSPDMKLEDFPMGEFKLTQITKTLGTAQVRGLIMPIPTEEEVAADLMAVAGAKGRNKTLRAVNLFRLLGLQDVPDALHAIAPMVFLDQDDPEFEQYAGLVSQGKPFENGKAAALFMPNSVRERARQAFAMYRANGEEKSAQGVGEQLALFVPSAVQDPAGFARKGSSTLNDILADIS